MPHESSVAEQIRHFIEEHTASLGAVDVEAAVARVVIAAAAKRILLDLWDGRIVDSEAERRMFELLREHRLVPEYAEPVLERPMVEVVSDSDDLAIDFDIKVPELEPGDGSPDSCWPPGPKPPSSV